MESVLDKDGFAVQKSPVHAEGLDVNTLYMLFCFFKLSHVVGKGLISCFLWSVNTLCLQCSVSIKLS